MMANRVGEQLGKYRLIRLLGRGSFAEVYLGEHEHLKTEAAVKVLHAQLAEDDAGDFLKEAQTIARLVHPHIVRIFDFDVQEGTPFLVMDYAPNGTLRQRHPKGIPLPRQMIVQYVKQVADALQYAHDQKLIHRDVKPENMLIGRRNEVLLSDFGTVQVAQSTHLGGIEKIAGTVAYMSPEQLQGRARTASDQYALGIVVYEWLCGERPFQGAFSAMASQHIFTPPAPLREKMPAISPGVEGVVLTALAKDYRQRFESIQAFATALEQASFQSSSNAVYAPPGAVLPVSPSTLAIVGQPSQVPQQPPVSNPSLQGAQGVINQPPQALYPVSNPYLPTVARVTTDPPAQIPQPLPVSSNPSLPVIAPVGAVQLPQVQQPLPSAAQPRGSAYQPVITDPARLRQQRWKPGRNGLLIALAALIIIAGSMTAYFALPKMSSPGGGPPACSGLKVCKSPDGEYIGISDGTFAFDTNRPDGVLKLQAANELKAHHIGTAEMLWRKTLALPGESNDAEALIYLEDQRVLASHAPYITLVVGTMLTGDYISYGRENLQGVYVAQKEFNDGLKLPGGVQVRLLIANTGSNDRPHTNIAVAKQVVQVAQTDKTIVGVMGWPFSGTSQNVIGILSVAHIPMISATAYFDFLTGISPYFFRVIASNQRQVAVGIQYVEQKLHLKRAALFADPTDLYSKELAVDFEQQFIADGNNIVVSENYTVGHPEMLHGLFQDALNHNPDLIYFAGDAADAGVLLTDLPASGPFAHLQVLGADLLAGGYHSKASTEFNRLHFTSFFDGDTWDFLDLAAKKPVFFTEYPQDFDPHKQHIGDPYGYTQADWNTMLSYDAMLALLTGSSIALSGGKKSFSPGDLQQALTKITGSQAIQGATGQISFGPDGNAVNKVVFLLKLNPNGYPTIDSVQGSFLAGS